MPRLEPTDHFYPAETPDDRETVHVWLEDGKETYATWTGKLWWAQGVEVFPVRWRRYEETAMLARGEERDSSKDRGPSS